jgi:hypothetical protein
LRANGGCHAPQWLGDEPRALLAFAATCRQGRRLVAASPLPCLALRGLALRGDARWERLLKGLAVRTWLPT